MARVNHKLVKQRLNEKRSSITDRQFFSSRILAGHFEDIATAQTKRYTPNEFEQTPAKQSDTQNDLASTESTGPETDSSQNPESEYTAEEYTAELTDEEKLEKAYQTLCPITKYSGKTLAEVLTVDPYALVWVANKYKGNPEISEAAKLICEHALSENNE